VDRVVRTLETRTNGDLPAGGLPPYSSIRIFVPSADLFGQWLDVRSLLQRVVDYVLTFTTGVTTSKGTGVWRRSDGVLLHERVRIVESYIRGGMDAPTVRRFLSGLAELAVEARQEEWLVVVDHAPIHLPGVPLMPSQVPDGFEARNEPLPPDSPSPRNAAGMSSSTPRNSLSPRRTQ